MPHLHCHHHLWKEFDKILLLIVRAGTVSDLDGHVSPLQRQLGSFSPSNRTPLFLPMDFVLQVFARKCHLLGLVTPGFGLGKERGRGGENLEELVRFLPGCNTRHRPISLHRCQFRPIRVQVSPCEPSKRPVDFHNLEQSSAFIRKL